ncbi:MAG TPA: FAD/NAD(P)-binding oxidoreductase [Thermoplasmatales archaeon]|nr:FAD/NAD(P)-binding oxidoreductase [Thermoplasmatales archaeon]
MWCGILERKKLSDKKILKKAVKVAKKNGFDNVEIKVEDRVVYLTGRVNLWEDFLKIGSLTGKIKGVRGVVNNVDYPGKKRRERKKGRNEKIGEADVVIIGAGVVGCFIARELSKYNLKIILLEKAEDVACGTTKANNAMVHTGIGEKMGTLKQKLCVKGHKMFDKISQELNIPYKKCGMLILTTKETLSNYKIPSFISNFICRFIIPFILIRRGKKLGIFMEKIGRKKLLEKEPNLTRDVISGVYSPTYGITCPYLLTIALAENAVENGVDLLLNTEVVGIDVENGRVKSVLTDRGFIKTNFIVNSAGLYADEIAEMAGVREYTIHPKKGSTIIFDKETGNYINHSITFLKFPRVEHYKGGGIMLTVDGNIQWGPTIVEVEDKEDTSVTAEEIEHILKYYSHLLPNFPKNKVIAYFAGVRASTFTEDFFIEASKKVKGFIHVAGIQSPGLAASPAIAEMVVRILKNEGLFMKRKKNFNPYGRQRIHFRELNIEEKKRLVEKNALYGRIVCRCEEVSEAEIVDAIHGKIPAFSVDAIKRRTRAGMGRCQGAFCLPRIVSIISRETGIPPEKIVKDGKDSNLFAGRAKCFLEEKND